MASSMASGLFLKGKDDLVYGPTGFSSDSRFLGFISNDERASACFLLSVTGRMRFTAGELIIDGIDVQEDARSLRQMSSVAGLHGVDDLDPYATVESHFRELEKRGRRPIGAKDISGGAGFEMRERSPWQAETFLDEWQRVFPSVQSPNFSSLVGLLSDEQQMCLRILLALAWSPAIFACGGFGSIVTQETRWRFLDVLAKISDGGTFVIFSYPDAQDFLEWMRTAKRPWGAANVPDVFDLSLGQRVAGMERGLVDGEREGNR
jgi:hypothetical protein